MLIYIAEQKYNFMIEQQSGDQGFSRFYTYFLADLF